MMPERFFTPIYYAGIVYGRAMAYCRPALPPSCPPNRRLRSDCPYTRRLLDASLSSDPNRQGESTISTP
jgi:hypothetical protein